MEAYLNDAMAQINQLGRIVSLCWADHAQSAYGSVKVTDSTGKTFEVILHALDSPYYQLDRIIIGIVVWVIQMQRWGNRTIPAGDIAEIVNPCRILMGGA